MSDVQMNYYGNSMEMTSWRLMDRLYKLLNQKVTVYLSGGAANYNYIAITGTPTIVGSDYVELQTASNSQTTPVLIPVSSILFLTVGGPITVTTTTGTGTTAGTPPVGTAITIGS